MSRTAAAAPVTSPPAPFPARIATTRFGDLVVDESRVLRFPEGLPGFPAETEWVLVPHAADGASPFVWLQSARRADLAFLLMPPALAFPDYAPPLPPDVDGAAASGASLWVVVTVPAGDPRAMTANLLGPIVLEEGARRGRQVVLGDDRYTTRHPVFPSGAAVAGAAGA